MKLAFPKFIFLKLFFLYEKKKKEKKKEKDPQTKVEL